MATLNEQLLAKIQSVCEAAGDDKYWPLIQDYMGANSDNDRRRVIGKLAEYIKKDLKKEAQSLVNKGRLDYEDEALSILMTPKPDGLMIQRLIKSFYENNKNATSTPSGFIALMKQSLRNEIKMRERAAETSRQVIGRARATYASGQGSGQGGSRTGGDRSGEGLRAILGKGEKRAVRRAIQKVLKKMKPEKAKFIKALIGWSPTKQPTAQDIAKIMGRGKRNRSVLPTGPYDKLTPSSEIPIGALDDRIEPGKKGMGFKRGSGKAAGKSAGLKKNAEWLKSTRREFAREMCRALKGDPAASHIFFGKSCDKVLGFTEDVGLIFNLPSQFLSEDSAEDMLIRLCQEACKE